MCSYFSITLAYWKSKYFIDFNMVFFHVNQLIALNDIYHFKNYILFIFIEPVLWVCMAYVWQFNMFCSIKYNFRKLSFAKSLQQLHRFQTNSKWKQLFFILTLQWVFLNCSRKVGDTDLGWCSLFLLSFILLFYFSFVRSFNQFFSMRICETLFYERASYYFFFRWACSLTQWKKIEIIKL